MYCGICGLIILPSSSTAGGAAPDFRNSSSSFAFLKSSRDIRVWPAIFTADFTLSYQTRSGFCLLTSSDTIVLRTTQLRQPSTTKNLGCARHSSLHRNYSMLSLKISFFFVCVSLSDDGFRKEEKRETNSNFVTHSYLYPISISAQEGKRQSVGSTRDYVS